MSLSASLYLTDGTEQSVFTCSCLLRDQSHLSETRLLNDTGNLRSNLRGAACA